MLTFIDVVWLLVFSVFIVDIQWLFPQQNAHIDQFYYLAFNDTHRKWEKKNLKQRKKKSIKTENV